MANTTENTKVDALIIPRTMLSELLRDLGKHRDANRIKLRKWREDKIGDGVNSYYLYYIKINDDEYVYTVESHRDSDYDWLSYAFDLDGTLMQ